MGNRCLLEKTFNITKKNDNMKSLRQLLKLFISIFNPVTRKNNRLIFYNAALNALGTDASPNDIVPDELGCAETVNEIHKKAFGVPIGGDVSTYRMYAALQASPYFKRVKEPLEGDVIISPTGYGNIRIMTGHVGIVGELTKIMNNDSITGKFIQKYTLKTWKERWQDKGGYPIHFYRRV